jgi:hypothetical protein
VIKSTTPTCHGSDRLFGMSDVLTGFPSHIPRVHTGEVSPTMDTCMDNTVYCGSFFFLPPICIENRNVFPKKTLVFNEERVLYVCTGSEDPIYPKNLKIKSKNNVEDKIYIFYLQHYFYILSSIFFVYWILRTSTDR